MQPNYSPLGLILFAIYLVFYGGFVFLNAFSPKAMEATPIGGLNIAILYGFALIVVAVVLSMIYGCLRIDLPESKEEQHTGAAQ